MHLRAFIAIEIDDQTKENLSGLITRLKESGADVKWITENQMHLTLKFLGNIGGDNVRDISNALSAISNNFKSFTTTFSKIGAFPNLNHPVVIWLGIDKGAGRLEELNRKIELAMEGLGFKKEGRIFKPHLTLGRVRSPKNIPALIKLVEKTGFNPAVESNACKLTLFQSMLSSKGAAYTRLSIVELKP